MLGNRISEIRKSKRLTQDQLAELAGISREQISRYETGKIFPDFETIIKIADALEVSLDCLAERSCAPAQVSKAQPDFQNEVMGKEAFTKEQWSLLNDLKKEIIEDVLSAIREDTSSSKNPQRRKQA